MRFFLMTRSMIDAIEIRGARVHNLKNVDADVPLGRIVAVAGVSGSGKSSLALGVLYAEGSRRYLESLSTYTRRRMTQAAKADVDEVLHVPAALALRQRPGIPGIRSTFGTGTELLNSLRLMFSRLASHRCPNGHLVPPSLSVAAEKPLVCPTCGASFYAPSAEDLSFNSQGACRTCSGTGVVRTVDRASLVPDESLTIDQGAVLPWRTLMWSLMTDVCRAMGVRTDVPFRELTEEEKSIVYDGPMVKKHIFYRPKNGESAGELDFTYYSAVNTVKNALAKVKDDAGMKRVARFLKEEVCPDCGGSRLSAAARAPVLAGKHLDEATAMTLSALIDWVQSMPSTMPEAMRPMAQAIAESFLETARRLIELGLGYLTLDRAAATLSTGERQRMQLAHAVRNRTTGVLYVLDEPSIGLHPANIVGLIGVMRDLVADGNTVVFVDHDVQILKAADHLIELGPKAGAEGGTIIAQGPLADIVDPKKCPDSKIAPFLLGRAAPARPRTEKAAVFDLGEVAMSMNGLHTVKPLSIRIPKGRLTVVTGVSGSGKTTVVLESLVPALRAKLDAQHLSPVWKPGDPVDDQQKSAAAEDAAARARMPSHVVRIDAPGIDAVKLIDASPIGINVRSTVATYANVHDELRKLFAKSPEAKARGWKAGDFSYNTGRLRCPVCDGTGEISLDVQFLPDVDIPCTECRGSRYCADAGLAHLLIKKRIKNPGLKAREVESIGPSMPEVMAMDVSMALKACADLPTVASRLKVLEDLGLGYLTLGESTPSLSGGEAQRLKLAAEMGRAQDDALFVFDEPTIGLHPLDVETLLKVFQTLIEHGATVVVIEHDLDVIRSADWIIDMGPGGGESGGRVVAAGTPEDIKACPESATGRFI